MVHRRVPNGVPTARQLRAAFDEEWEIKAEEAQRARLEQGVSG
jgi:hypothetical protein